MEKIIVNLANKIKENSLFNDMPLEDIISSFEVPADSKLGDIALPCFKFSKALRNSPQAIASQIQESFANIEIPYIKSSAVVGGYLNFYISAEYFTHMLDMIISHGKNYGKGSVGNGKTVVVEYSSPNIAKKFHIGHLGTTLIGNSLKKIYKFAGYDVVSINYLGDWGTQFGKVIAAYKMWGNETTLEERGMDELVDLYVRFSKESEQNEELHEAGQTEFRKLEQNDEENLLLWQKFKDISLIEYEKTYKLLGVDFDCFDGESFYHNKMQPIIDELNEKGLLEFDDGAYLVRLDEYKMPPTILLKSDGSTIYATRDLAAAKDRFERYSFDRSLYVTSAGQSLHFAQFFKVLELMGYEWAKNLTHIPYGTYSFGGEKIASRTGNVVLLSDLFDDAIERALSIINDKNPNLENKTDIAKSVGVGAIIFGALANSRIRDVNFNWEEALSFEGNTGPYVQYTYARTASILRKQNENVLSADDSEDTYLPQTEEVALIKALSLFPEKVIQAINADEPSVISRYALDICSAFNLFYHNINILKSEGVCREFRLNLTKATNDVLGNVLELLGMSRTEVI